ncbi:hypothetical protein GUJ93_ZPchr0002g25618 [Zizania palustris]|uniref:Clp R domain-containing protein n=1 Tax=Zizania palustris TaxID=103762 RepID=A0A8J5RVM5_ZIZPA|nr:hypothetical protein GUJ93_ZPchr0002g25618 [Zizania palustris]
MRAGGCTVQQSLTAAAAAVVKQAVSLARRRGNAQVTPLHVASAMLQAAAPSGLLRAACLRSHSHPLQCKALDLCFNVALNRLPVSAAASPLLGHGHVYYPPVLSNALVAAFKRAQAHQRRGSVETQQQSVLAVKIELEQLVISILDDPSVSRVMREAGFSSTQVKANVEQVVFSMEANKPGTTCTTTAAAQNPNPSAVASSSPVREEKPSKLSLDQVREEDVAAILDCMATRRKRRIMVVAESAGAAEAAARAAVDKINRGETKQHEALRLAQVVTLSVSRFRDAQRDETERRLAELRCVVKARGRAGGAVVLVVEDLAWAAEFWAGRAADAGRRAAAAAASCYYYCAVEHAVAEVRALACRGDGVRLICHGTYQTNMRCLAGHPSLESLWGLQTLAVPAGSLALSLNCADAGDSSAGSCQLMDGSTCCGDCAATKALRRSAVDVLPSTSIPPWLLHQCRDEEAPHCKKWMAVSSPCSSVSSYEQYYQLHQPWLVAADAVDETKHPWKSRCRGDLVGDVDGSKHVHANKVKHRDSSASNGSVEVECRSKFKELSAENLKVLCGALEKEVPWQKEIVPEIASTVLRCRSGMAKRSRDDDGSKPVSSKEDTWMFFLGGDVDGKVRVARELACLVFGSSKSFVSIDSSEPSPARSYSTGQLHRSKRPRPETSGRDHLERLYDAVRHNPRRVILMERIEQAERHFQQGIMEAIESGVVRSRDGGGEDVVLGDAIIVLSCDCESFDSRSTTACSLSSSCIDLNMGMVEDEETEERCHGEATGLLLNAVDRVLFFRSPEC